MRFEHDRRAPAMANSKPDVVLAPDGHNAYKCDRAARRRSWTASPHGGFQRAVAHVVSSTAAAAEVAEGEQRTNSAELWLIDDRHNARGLIELVTLMGASPKSRQGAWWCNWPPASKLTARCLTSG